MTNNPNQPVQMPSTQETLDKIGDTLGARENNYNNPKDNFDDIAAVWTQLLKTEGIIPRDHAGLTALSVARLMVGMKLVRDAYKVKLDNWVDTAGYGVCGLRIAEYMELVDDAKLRAEIKAYANEWAAKYDDVSERVLNKREQMLEERRKREQERQTAIQEYYTHYNVDLTRPMTTSEQINLQNWLYQRGLLDDK